MDTWKSAFVRLRPRIVLLGTGGVVGVLVGGLGVALLTVLSEPHAASSQVFSLGALVFGFGVLGWSGSVLAGNGIEAMRYRLDIATDWTERKSRRAMARISGFGGGVMVGVVLSVSAIVPLFE